ncbi:BTAD domain-containing putative transcriptional regulator [Dactylosporangium sp. AC04546]|uniref:ATP-binding protein n=1 Tax=Dactylosporangium sp. AC04546 TaxID=2862460 RepID=UPI001EDF62E6|nr:BTAD domain-containing putative transcriptional regulator [Dactylosporangium sp. AC04546]WVK80490.1 BTAD domain-containing putative transcriptional regulator [Dactylosporangium sp. AC04546]
MATPSPYLQILGPLRIWRDGAELDAGPRQQAYLLALLLARAGRPTRTSELIDLIWGDDVPSSALNVLHKYVGALRRLLEPLLPIRETGSFLHRRGNAYLLAAGPATLDLVAFRELVDAARSALTRHDHHAALDHYVSALGLWHGPAGDGIADGTIATTVFAALDNEFYAVCTAAAELAVSVGKPERVLAPLQLAVSMAPFNEPVLAALVVVLGAAGRQAEALSVFRQVRDRLADELGVDPGPALEDAQRRILTQPSAAPPGRAADQEAAWTVAATFIGRAEELATLRRIVERAVAGHTAIGVVEGEPGAGKTRLLEEAAAVAGRLGALAVWGSCLEGDGTPAMWPWEQALGTVVQSLPPAVSKQWLTGELGVLAGRDDATRQLPDGNAQFRLFEQVVALVGQASARRPTLLILDDLQWADAASLQLLHHLAGRLPHGTAIIGALRDRAPTVSPDLSRVLAAASRRPGHRRFRLGPLGLADVAELVRQEAGREAGDAVARAIHTRTSGNPFFVRELSRLLSEVGAIDGDTSAAAGVPSTVHDVVRDRMAGLDDPARDLLRVAALIGRDVDLRLLSRATGVAVADCLRRLEPLHTLGLLETGPQDPSTLRFAHDLVRESVSETATQQQVTQLHLRVADALEHIHAGDEDVAERLAYHLWAAGPLAEPVRVAEALIRAGRRAAAKLAFESANRQLRSAVQTTRASGLMEPELAALTLLAIVVRRQSGYDASTFDLLERAEYLARALGRETEAADFLFIRLMGAYTSLEHDRAQLARRMHELGQASGDPAVRRYGRQAWGLHQWDIGNIGEAYRSFTEVDAAAADGTVAPDEETPLRRDGSIPGEGPGWRAVMTALHGDVGAAQAFVDTWDKPGDPYAASVWVYYTTMIASMAGDAEVALRAGERWADAGLARLRAQIDHYIRQSWCWARALTGEDPAGAAAEAEELLVANLLQPPQWGVAYHYALIAEMWLAAGSPDRADAALERADQAMWDHGQRYAEGLLLLLKARLLQARGAPVAAVRAAAERASARSAACEAHLFARRTEQFLAELGGTT